MWATNEWIEQNTNIDYPPPMAGSYGFLPTPPEHLENYLAKAFDCFEKQNHRKAASFLDLGCGAGNVLLKMKSLGITDVTGVELGENAYFEARKNLPQAEIIRADIRKWKPDRQYDLVYIIQPFEKSTLWIEFLRHFSAAFPKGQIFIAPFGVFDFMLDKFGIAPASPLEVWQLI